MWWVVVARLVFKCGDWIARSSRRTAPLIQRSVARILGILWQRQTLALPIVSFILGSDRNDNYRNRAFYNSQNNWNNWRPGNGPPPAYGNGYGNGFRPQPQRPRPPIAIQPPRPPIVRPEPPRPPRLPCTSARMIVRRHSRRVPSRLVHKVAVKWLPGFVKPGPSSPAAQR